MKGAASARSLWLDVGDFVEYAIAGNNNVSGIQRVAASLISSSNPSFRETIPVIPDYFYSRFLHVNAELVHQFAKIMENGGASTALIEKSTWAILGSRTLAEPQAGDVFVFPGCFWIYSHYDLIAELRAKGVIIVLLVYDLIQIRSPDFVSPEATRIFTRKFVDMMGIVDLVLTDSEYVAADVRSFLREALSATVPVRAVQLATEISAGSSQPDISRISSVPRETDYVLFVSTIEIRKNHKLLVAVWERLRAEYPGPVPKLVFAGKWGWMVEDLRAELEQKGAVGDWLLIKNSLSDAALADLYRNALFTIYPSFAEGWGLPVGESLAYGTPCVASNATSIPEVGGDLVRYFDPHNADEAYRLVATVLSDREGLDGWRGRIRREFKPRTWSDFSADVYAAIAEGTDRSPELGHRLNYALPPGRVLPCGDQDVDRLFRRGDPLLTIRMARVSGWGPVGEAGVLTNGPRAVLRFGTALPVGTRTVVYMHAQSPAGSLPDYVAVEVGGVETRVVLEPRRHLVKVGGCVNSEGALEIVLEAHWRATPADGVNDWLQLFWLAYCDATDPAARLALLEKVTIAAACVHEALSNPRLERARPEPELRDEQSLLRRFLVQRGEPRRQRSVWKRIAAAWLLRSARRRSRRGVLGAAERAYRRLLSIAPNRAKVWVQYGHTIKDRGDLPAAIAAYRMACRIDADDDDARLHYGRALEADGRHSEARHILQGHDRIADGSSV